MLSFFNIFNSLSSNYHSHSPILILSHLSFSNSPSRGSNGVVDDCKWVEGPTVVGPIAGGGLLNGSQWSWWVSVDPIAVGCWVAWWVSVMPWLVVSWVEVGGGFGVVRVGWDHGLRLVEAMGWGWGWLGQEIHTLWWLRSPAFRFVEDVRDGNLGQDDEAAFRAVNGFR